MPTKLPEKQSPLKGAKPARQAGSSVQDELDNFLWGELYLWFVMPGMLLVGTVLMWMMVWTKTPTRTIAWILTGYFLLSVVLAVYRFYHSRQKIQNLKQGRDGERIVGALLEELRKDGYRVFHDIPNAKKITFNIDHIVIGPGGVFTIETKTFSKLIVGDKKISYENNQLIIPGLPRQTAEDALNQAKAAANFVKKKLTEATGHKIQVQPLLIFPGWFVDEPTITSRANLPVWVINEKRIFDWIGKASPRLSREDISLYTYRLKMHIDDCHT